MKITIKKILVSFIICFMMIFILRLLHQYNWLSFTFGILSFGFYSYIYDKLD